MTIPKKVLPHALMVTCEHASNALPIFILRTFANLNEISFEKKSGSIPNKKDPEFKSFKSSKFIEIPKQVLESTEGYDIHAFNTFSRLIKNLKPDFHCSGKFSRLIVDLSKNETSSEFYSNYIKEFPDKVKNQIHEIWFKYHRKIRTFIENSLDLDKIQNKNQLIDLKNEKHILHLSLHTFSSLSNKNEAKFDVIISYDLQNPAESFYAERIINEIKNRLPKIIIRKNYSNKSNLDDMMNVYRKDYGNYYLGLKIKINQRLF